MPTDAPTRHADVSVVVPAYRAAKTIARTLQSIAAQTLPPREVIVVDDGSDDGTAQAAEAMRPVLAGIRFIVVTQENGGAGAARNRAIAHATSTWLAFLDADDEWLAEKLDRTFTAIDTSGREPVLVSHDVIVRDGETEVVVDCATNDVGDADPFHAMYRRGYVSTSTALARRDAVVNAGGFDVTLPNAQDFDLWLALLAQPGTQVLVFPGAYTRHHNQPGSIQTYTARRLHCGSRIAERYIPVLRQRRGCTAASVAFRIVAIHAEAIAAHLQKKAWSSLALVAFGFVGSMVKALPNILRSAPVARPGWIPAIEEDG